MILYIYSLILFYIARQTNKYIDNFKKNLDKDNLPKLILSILFYNKLLTSMQIAAAYLFLACINPLSVYLYLPQFKIIIYHFIILIGSLIKDVKLENFGYLSYHTYVINFFMLLDVLKVLN